MPFSESWTETDPDGDVITVSLLDDSDRLIKRAVRERMEGDPADVLTGLLESGSWAAAPKPRKGACRAHVVTEAGVAALTNEDGRFAITSDTKRLFHIATAGDTELDYVPSTGTPKTITAVHTFNPTVAGAPFILGANATGQLVTGLNADLLDGQSGAFYQDSSNQNAGTLPAARLPAGVARVVARTTAASSVTGTAAETTLATLPVPGNSMGINGRLRITITTTEAGAAGAKTLRVKFGTSIVMTLTQAATDSWLGFVDAWIWNKNATNSQDSLARLITPTGTTTPNYNSSRDSTGTEDTTANVDVVITGQLVNTADTLTVLQATVEVMPS